MKTGEYIRINGKIGKIKDIVLNGNLYEDSGIYLEDEKIILGKEEIHNLKSSKNIINLIEVGDILLIKDFVDEASMIFNDMYYVQNENQLFNIKRDLEKNKNMKISKILTKEQYENNSYKVEE